MSNSYNITPETSSRVKISKFIFGITVPFLFLPMPLVSKTPESRCGYVILLMACYWVIEPIPVPATSLLPIVLFPLLGILSTSEVSLLYMNGAMMMFLGGLFTAIAVEDCNLHHRIALNMLRRVRMTIPWMLFGFMATSMFLSMWISNTATTALMVPIIEAVVQELSDKTSAREAQNDKRMSFKSDDFRASTDNSVRIDIPISNELPQKTVRRKEMAQVLKRILLLSVAYSSNIGGTGTLTGTATNLIAKGIVERIFPESNDLTFDKWMMYNAPVMVFCVFIAWGYLFLIHARKTSSLYTNEMKTSFQEIIKRRHEELGPMLFREKAVSVLFILLVMLWIFRDPYFISGWASYFPLKVSDATSALAIPILMFLIPADPWHMGNSPSLLVWKSIQQKVPWGVLLLLGGGFSLAAASKKSGLSNWLTQQLLSLNISSPLAVVSLLTVMTAIITDFTSNSSTANILLPVVAELAVAMKVHPLYFMVPVTVATSFAFMLPVATVPNAIVYEAGAMKTLDMLKPGIFMNLLCVSVEILMINTYGNFIFNFDVVPSWINSTRTTSIS